MRIFLICLSILLFALSGLIVFFAQEIPVLSTYSRGGAIESESKTSSPNIEGILEKQVEEQKDMDQLNERDDRISKIDEIRSRLIPSKGEQ